MFLFILFVLVSADPTPNGGKLCNYTSECGGGICDFKLVNGTEEKICNCYPQYGNYDCSYKRIDKSLAGGLQIGLSFFGVFGVGNFVLGRTNIGVGQLIMGFSYLATIICIPCVLFCGLFGDAGTEQSRKGVMSCIVCIVVICGFGWNLADGIKMLQGSLPDVNNYNLY
jgi:hypothetical protein